MEMQLLQQLMVGLYKILITHSTVLNYQNSFAEVIMIIKISVSNKVNTILEKR